MATRSKLRKKKRRVRPAAGSLVEYRRKRDFRKSDEPPGRRRLVAPPALAFVIQKHAASHLHFDLRLELDGVMKSWAVPKGPSRDPMVKRLAMHVEDHPIAYNEFEGTIPKGEYGGGTVMIWDRGTYTSPDDGVDAIRDGYHAGRLRFVLNGDRLQGQWALVRMHSKGEKQWLLIKHGDEFAQTGDAFAASDDVSVVTGRSMDEIANGGGAPTAANATARPKRTHTKAASTKSASIKDAGLAPMLASVANDVPSGDDWEFEPKYDGIRVLAFVDGDAVALVSRNGNDKAVQFPEIVDALAALGAKRKRAFVIDGEIVARRGRTLGRFQALQERIGQTDEDTIAAHARNRGTAFVAFDLLLDGSDTLAGEPWTDRRAHLEALLEGETSAALRLAESTRGSGARLLAKAKRAGWEGVMAKRVTSAYTPGVRSGDWLKLKIEARQEFVVGGWTEPRRSREHLGALLIGYWQGGVLKYAGHVGGGFTRVGLAEMYKRLKPLERKTSPFDAEPDTNDAVHWTRPETIVEVKFNEWTNDGRLRQPIFLGMRDDKQPRSVGREPASVQPRAKHTVSEQLSALEAAETDGEVTLGKGITLAVSNLGKVYFAAIGGTKGDTLRYYDAVSAHLLPLIADRPLVLKRYPDGADGPSFFQQNAPPKVPKGVRVERVPAEEAPGRRFIGGDLATLLYCVQLGALDVNPWHSRVGTLNYPDYTILDLDPGPKATFATIVRVARALKELLDDAGISAGIKTSGSRGLHIVIPLVPRTSEETAQLVARIFAQRAADAMPKLATVARMKAKRPPAAVYVDYLQNIVGKSVAAAFSIRPRPDATVSTPLDWSEVTPKLDPSRFTMESVPGEGKDRVALWNAAMKRRNRAGTLTE